MIRTYAIGPDDRNIGIYVRRPSYNIVVAEVVACPSRGSNPYRGTMAVVCARGDGN
jgi:hypothetical protein